MEERYEFNEVPLFTAFAVGAPGKRTFFLGIGEKKKWARVWLEKEHLEAFGPAIDELLFTISQSDVGLPGETDETISSDAVPSGFPFAELEIDQISLSYEHATALLTLLVHGMGPQRETPAVVNCRVTLAQFKKLGDQARNLCAAGRPLCHLCGYPIDPEGHICPELS